MGAMKRLMEEHEQQLDVGRQIAIEAGVLELCEFHEVAVYNNRNVERAYRLGNTKFSAGALRGVFDTRREMTDAIQKAVEESAIECYFCEKWRAE
jgi:hypothetical protein